ncbi:nuclear transport factor 2 family protein [Microlunatus soli]|uniref:SnoaL-like domain-containing protein n=1 Tax=Microlunatus soli TaxID=630515 RepID=A0A1H1UU77_9ACTN|nr:nuclear transport factor 2 family protein [Microlunatus soli]SDS75870.1 SnoaL-like domain-containing protein [Microlunatus soli]
MTPSTTTALDVSLAYFRSWTGGDFDAALAFIAPDIVCHTPSGVLTGAEAFAGFMGPFAGMLTSADLLAAYGDDRTTMIMYDTVTPAVAAAPGAELHTVADERITEIKIIFDRLPFAKARASVTSAD